LGGIGRGDIYEVDRLNLGLDTIGLEYIPESGIKCWIQLLIDESSRDPFSNREPVIAVYVNPYSNEDMNISPFKWLSPSTISGSK
jgi:hypothetical protein